MKARHKLAEIIEDYRNPSDFLSFILDSLPVLVSYVDQNHCYQYNNKAYEKRFGISREAIKGRHVREILGSVVYDQVKPQIEAALRGELARTEIEIPTPNGVSFARGTFFPDVAPDGEVRGFIVFGEETSAAKATERALSESEARFHLLVEKTNIIAWEAELETAQFTYVSPQATAILGYPVEDWYTPDFWSRHIHPEDRKMVLETCFREAKTKPKYEFEYRMLHKDGPAIWIRDIVSVVERPGGKRVLTGFMIDITEQKAVEEALAEREQLYRKLAEDLEKAVVARTEELSKSRAFLDSLVENIPNMIFVKDASELRFVRFNRAGEALLGFSREDLIGKNDYDFFPKEQADYFTSRDRETLENRVVVDIPEEPIETRNHGRRILHTKKIPILGADGRPEYLLGISEDITEQKRAEGERLRLLREQVALEERLEAREEFLSIASHELKTPITSLKLQLQMAKRGLQSDMARPMAPEKLNQIFDVALRQIDRLVGLVEDLLDVSRIGAGKLAYVFTEVDVSKLIEDMIERYQEQLRAAGCRINLNRTPGLRIRGDQKRLEQVVLNLLSNAAKFGRGQPIEVGTESHVGFVRIWVEDRGCGIPPEFQQKVFERFERVESESNISGLGLGLYISREIVRAHDGKIWVESQPGRGARFIVDLPETR